VIVELRRQAPANRPVDLVDDDILTPRTAVSVRPSKVDVSRAVTVPYS
jgi:hypothetical protein